MPVGEDDIRAKAIAKKHDICKILEIKEKNLTFLLRKNYVQGLSGHRRIAGTAYRLHLTGCFNEVQEFNQEGIN